MAGDWLKIEHTTPDKPEVIMMAARLKTDSDSIVGKLLRIWIWADQNTIDGNAVAVTSAFLDRLTGRKGFASAMRACGWLTGEDGALSFPGFSKHNGRSAKARAETNRRVSKHRRGNANVTDETLQKPLPEKRREENTSSKEAVFCGGGTTSDPIEQARTLCEMHPKRDLSQPALRAALAAIRNHGFDLVAEGVRSYSAAVAAWTPAERLQFVRNAPEFFGEDLWNQPATNWRGRKGPNAALPNGQHRTINVGGRQPSGIMTFDDDP